jgi:hypothetical protein
VQLFVENLLKVLKVLKTEVKGSTARKPRLQRANLSKAVNACALPSLERLRIYYKLQNGFDKN